MKFFAPVSLAAVILAAGCSSSRPDTASSAPVGSSASAIQGGVDDTQHPFAVGVCGTVGGGSRGNCSLFCSGALIAPNLVVTARHCVTNSPEMIDCATATFGTPLDAPAGFSVTTSSSMQQSSVGWHAVKQIVTPPDTHFCGNDIALLVLAANVPASEATPITPIVQYPMTDHDRYSSQQTAIGYGVTSPTTNTQGTRRIRQMIDIVCIPGDDTGLDCGNLAQRNIAQNEFIAGDGTCSGDSGSSAYEQVLFDKGVPSSFGVLSRGGVSGATCVGSVYTRLDKWRDLIVSTVTQAAAAGGYPLPSWTVFVPPPPKPDAGAKPPPPPVDSGVTTDPVLGSLGQTCSADKDCASALCRSASGAAPDSACSQACDATATCPSGYACQAGFCFVHVDPPKAAPAVSPGTTTTTTGCAIVSPGRSDPTKPVPWRWLAVGAIALLAALRRRHGRAAPLRS